MVQTGTATSSKTSSATGILWSVVSLAILIGVIAPVSEEVGDFASGYFRGSDYPIQAILPTLCVFAFLIFFALANWILHLGVRWRSILLALVLHLSAVAAGVGIMNWDFLSMVDGVVARAQRAVEAIHSFENAYGRAPVDLSELAPEFLPHDPTLLYENGPMLNYELDHPSLHPEVGAWTIRQSPFESIRLEYAPQKPRRALDSDEQRRGDWIVSVSNPCWPSNY